MARNINYGCLGNGFTVWNNAKEVNGDYEKVAHISQQGKITFYPKDLSATDKEQVELIRNIEIPDWKIIEHLVSLGFHGTPISKHHYDEDESCLTAYKAIQFNGKTYQARQFSSFFGYRQKRSN